MYNTKRKIINPRGKAMSREKKNSNSSTFYITLIFMSEAAIKKLIALEAVLKSTSLKKQFVSQLILTDEVFKY